MHVPHHFPTFLWRFWLSNSASGSRLHIYDVYSSELSEIRAIPAISTRPVFEDFDDPRIYPGTLQALQTAERAFISLQNQTELVLGAIIDTLEHDGAQSFSLSRSIPMEPSHLSTLIKFFVFLRFRNSAQYRDIVHALKEDTVLDVHSGNSFGTHNRSLSKGSKRVSVIYGPLWRQIRCQAVLNSFISFFETESPTEFPSFQERPDISQWSDPCSSSYSPTDPIQDVLRNHLFQFCQTAEVCLGMSEDQEYILPDGCFGILDEAFGWAGEELNPGKECFDSFFPIHPKLALYVIGGNTRKIVGNARASLDIGLEAAVDVHLRVALILSAVPHSNSNQESHDRFSSPEAPRALSGPKFYFASLSSITRSLSSYDEFRVRWMPEQFIDYSRLKQRCRQLFSMERVTKTLIIKGDVVVVDLTDEVKILGTGPVACGAFSDVWKGRWWDPVERKERQVAIKSLRRVMVRNVQERLLKRLQAEVLTWHRLCHRNISPFFGIVSIPNSVGMVSEWCVNGTVGCYLKERNPGADRMVLLVQIASGLRYLHSVDLVHGDLKGGNILIDAHGRPLITDFGLSHIIEDLSATIPEMKHSSSFAGTARWMAPELVLALAEDNVPQVTKQSDCYAFAAVCLEIITDALPYPCRTNDSSVTLDIIRGFPPSHGSLLSQGCMEKLRLKNDASREVLISVLDSCWNQYPDLRPTMDKVQKFLIGLEGCS
ncbi:kinase-like domain-containing protein [Mycena floridula]|nr:kinase-like domain-containing protein [Mycena floridula]